MKCDYHPEREAVGRCIDCGKEICSLCLTTTAFNINAAHLATPLADKHYCPTCIEKLIGQHLESSPDFNIKPIVAKEHLRTNTEYSTQSSRNEYSKYDTKPRGKTSWTNDYVKPRKRLSFAVLWVWFCVVILISGVVFAILSFLGSSSTSNLLATPTPTPTATPTPTPQWVGPNGETEHEYVMCGFNCYNVGGDGNKIELVNNPDATDPTWNELKSFLSQDKTDKKLYDEDSFLCGDFAEMLHNNAEESGIRAAYVSLNLSSGLHACNAFNTIDDGLVYIDDTGRSSYSSCSADKKVTVSIGSKYIPKSIFPCAGWSSTWESSGTVTNVSIQW